MRHTIFSSIALISALQAMAELVEFSPCPSNTFGLVESVDITPCERGASDEPCRFRFGSEYTISIEYTPLLSSGDLPRNNLQARDDSVQPSLRYPYSGQAFDVCEYTACPVQAGVSATWTYPFKTLQSRFNHLTVNATTELAGESFLCVGFDALYLPTIAGRKLR